MDKQLQKRLLITVQHYPSTGLTDFADKQYGTPTTRQGYLEDKMSYVHLPDGTRSISQATLYFDGLIPVTPYDMMHANGVDYPVLMTNTFPGIAPGTGTTVVFI